MKIDARQFAALVRDPGAIRVVLLHGDDEGLVRERAQMLVRSVAGSLNDPFLVEEIERDGWRDLPGAMAALSLMGGRKAIRLREVTDAAAPWIKAALDGAGEALAVLEAPGLGRGKLRTLVEASPKAAAIACYPDDGPAAMALVRAQLGANRVSAEEEALAWLVERCGGDRGALRGEAEKLALLAGPGGAVTLDMARAVAGDSADASADGAIQAAMAGQIAAADTACARALADGLGGVGLLRVALSHVQRLHAARASMEAGLSAGEAVRQMRPPVFFRAVGAVSSSLSLWTVEQLGRALDELRAAELGCKQTASRPDVLAARCVASLARQATARRARPA